MSIPTSQRTAKILQFPQKPRDASLEAYRSAERAGTLRSIPFPEFGSGWYHEAALQEAERTRKP